MSEADIFLYWRGPISFASFSEKKMPADHIEMDRTGVYLHCFRMGEAFVVIYVGKAAPTSIWKRNRHHYENINSFSYALFDWKKIDTHGDLDVTFIPNYDDKLQRKFEADPAELIRRIRLFYAPVLNEENIRGIEGAIQIHLWRNMATRKYLITPISNYGLKGFVLKNEFDSKDVILGLEGEKRIIRTPSAK